MKKHHFKSFPLFKILTAVGIFCFVLALIYFVYQGNTKKTTPSFVQNKKQSKLVAKKSTNKAQPGIQTYAITQKGQNGPEFYKAVINPEKVQPGMAQTMSVWVKDPKSVIRKVVAEIETDNGIVVESLHLVEGTETDGVWSGNWKVKDTTNRSYSTTFTAENAKREKSKSRLGWTDPGLPCYVGTADCDPAVGTYTVSWLEGADGGTFTMNEAGVSITVPNNTALNVGLTFNYTLGTLNVNEGGYLQTGYICCPDADTDGYCTPYCTWSINNGPTCNAGWKRKAGGTGQCQGTGASVNYGYDCYDSGTNAATAFPGQTACQTAARGDASYDYNCDGGITYCYATNGGCNAQCNVTQGFGSNPGCGGGAGLNSYYVTCSQGYTTCSAGRTSVVMSCR